MVKRCREPVQGWGVWFMPFIEFLIQAQQGKQQKNTLATLCFFFPTSMQSGLFVRLLGGHKSNNCGLCSWRFVWLYITSETGRISRLSKNGEEKVVVLTQEGLWFFCILLSQLSFRHAAVCKVHPVNRQESSMWDVSAKSHVTFSSTDFFSPT